MTQGTGYITPFWLRPATKPAFSVASTIRHAQSLMSVTGRDMELHRPEWIKETMEEAQKFLRGTRPSTIINDEVEP